MEDITASLKIQEKERCSIWSFVAADEATDIDSFLPLLPRMDMLNQPRWVHALSVFICFVNFCFILLNTSIYLVFLNFVMDLWREIVNYNEDVESTVFRVQN